MKPKLNWIAHLATLRKRREFTQILLDETDIRVELEPSLSIATGGYVGEESLGLSVSPPSPSPNHRSSLYVAPTPTLLIWYSTNRSISVDEHLQRPRNAHRVSRPSAISFLSPTASVER